VSLLVPARDEAENLRETLPGLLAVAAEGIEVLVLDDASSDGTARLLAAAERESGGGLRRIAGEPLPAGWLGKSWACHQLARAAGGEVLVFCDADVAVRPEAVRRTVGALLAADAGALTALPRHRLGTLAERAVVPLVALLPVLALLPLSLVPRTRAPALSMANGQWIAFTRAAYRASGGHERVRGEVVEDVALARNVKAAGHRLRVVLSTSLLGVRMYRGGAALRDGFGKNLYALAGGRPGSFLVALAVFLLTAVFPWAAAALGVRAALLPLALLAAVRVCGALLFRHGWASVLLHPAGSLAVAALALESCFRARRGSARWKGRPTRVG
jgi:chlorobactene glucosyltransferase